MGSSVALIIGGWLVVSVPLALVVGRCIAARDRGSSLPGAELERLAPVGSAPPSAVIDLTDRALARSRQGLPPG
jgi:hypothetical protein